ncbi:MAG: MOSC domain-containing protein, partial [Gemmatimonadota bacterium]|nr:MOSC domain-containing protein [Gemmatimonadota bacterium]
DGMVGDRSWAIRDETRSQIEGARKLPGLLECEAHFVDIVEPGSTLPVPQITLPDGTQIAADAKDLPKRLTEFLGCDVTIWPRVDASNSTHYERAPFESSDMTAELRNVFARLEDEPLPDLGKLPPESLMAATLPGTYFDCFPIMLMSTTALDSLAAARPASQFDRRRFRANFVVDVGQGDGFPENEWIGKNLRIGEAVFEMATECPRCVMTTHAQNELPKDPGIMRALVQENGGNLGVYARVATPGLIREGDAVEITG